MTKTFKSIAEIEKYIKRQHKLCLSEIGRKGESKMKEITHQNLYNSYSPDEYKRTGDMVNNIRVSNIDNNSVEIEMGQGGHTSWVDGRGVYVAPILEEGGHTYERKGSRKAPTNIIDDTMRELEDIAPQTYISVMASKGIKVHKK